MTPQAHRLVGRQRELALLERTLDKLGTDSADVMQVVGEPGIGKTSLLAEAAQRADERGHTTLIGRGAEFERDMPFGIIVDALDDHLASLDQRELDQLGEDRIGELAPVFPALASTAGERPTGRDERYRSYRAVRILLEQLAARRPLVLALDDLHWADTASTELVHYLLRRRPEAAVLLLVAYRPGQTPPRLASVLDAEVHEGTSDRIELTPLRPTEADELLGEELDRATRDRLYHQSGGNPFYLEQLARAAQRGSPTAAADEGFPEAGVPPAVSAAIADEIGALAQPVCAVLQAAAVVGDPFEPDIVAETADVTEAEALAALDELLDVDLVRSTEVPRRFRFRHPIVRSAVYESARAGSLLAAHGRVASALAERGAPTASRAHHVERSARMGDEAALALLVEAGHQAAPRAPATAARWFQAALRLLPDGPDSAERRLELLVPMAVALGAAGRLEESRETLRQVLDLLPAEPTPLRVQAVASTALVEHLLSDHDQAQKLLLKALSDLPDQRSLEAAQLEVVLAAGCFFIGDFEGMRHWARQTVEARTSDGALNATAVGALALAEYSIGHVPQAQAHVAKAADIVDGLTDDELATGFAAVLWLSWAEMSVDLFEEASRHLGRGISVSRTTGREDLLIGMLLLQAVAYNWLGRSGEAIELAETAIESSLLAANDLFLALALAVRCMVEIEVGELATAIRLAEQAISVGEKTRSPTAALADCFLAEAWLELGHPKRCLDQLLASDGSPDFPPVPAFELRWYGVLTRAELALDRPEGADVWATRAENQAQKLGLRGDIAQAQRARAAVLLAQGDATAAAETALASASAAESANGRIQAAQSRLLAGTALAQAGEHERALAELEHAEAELSACGAQRFRDKVARELRRLGRRVPRAGRRGKADSGVEALSKRQREVAELVTAGQTNREIAAALVLSEKTIESHLSNIFSKLDVTSRAEVAAATQRARDEAGA